VINTYSKFALFNYGFRPFFLLAGLYAVIAMLIWLTIHIIGIWPIGTPTSYLWHAHDVVWFCRCRHCRISADRCPQLDRSAWILRITIDHLVVVWLGGRLVFPFYAHLPSVFIAIVDLAFFPVLGLMLTPSLIKGKSRNLVFLLFLLFLFSANLIFHVALVQNNVVFASYGLLFGINIVLLIITIIGGRIVPAFTLSAIRRTDDTFVIMPCPALDRIAIASILLVLITDLIWPYSAAAGWLALIAALIHAVRLARWQTLRGLGEAIVWILHIGYAWVIIGLALKGLFLLTGAIFGAAWMHAFTTGAFATMILAVMTRAALGHTGRPLIAPPRYDSPRLKMASLTGPSPNLVPMARVPSSFITLVVTRVSCMNIVAVPPTSCLTLSTIW